ncbi:MAG: magnesium/cobalt transporter CorA [Pirellulales bacterium]|nr:magnesium/cobalt transporter CorA [Pirellulales bacterium]
MANNGRAAKRRAKRGKLYFARRTAPGAPPGTLKANPNSPRPVLKVIAYGNQQFVERELRDPEELKQILGHYPVGWLNVDGLGDENVIARIGQVFGLHLLALEDVMNTHQRAKVEDYGDYLFVTARMVNHGQHVETEQLSMFLGRNFVITFQEFPGDSFDPVRERLRNARGMLHASGPDYLAYALLDSVIDAFFPALEHYGEMLDELEAEVLTAPNLHSVSRIHEIKNELILLRRAIWPQREAINTLLRDPHDIVSNETRLHLRDCYDHTVQIIDLVEVYREIASGLTDLFVSSASNRMNEVMKVLTIIATIFIPLTFITSIYGMNFNTDASPWNMPELNMPLGYVGVWVVMVAVSVGMLYFFWRKGWLRSFTPSTFERGGRRDWSGPPENGNGPAAERPGLPAISGAETKK